MGGARPEAASSAGNGLGAGGQQRALLELGGNRGRDTAHMIATSIAPSARAVLSATESQFS